jgi:hypothetical protein
LFLEVVVAAVDVAFAWVDVFAVDKRDQFVYFVFGHISQDNA